MKKILFLLAFSLITLFTYSQTVGKYIEFTAAPNTTQTVKLSQTNNYYIIKGTPTIVNNDYLLVNDATTPVKGMVIQIYWNAVATYTGSGVVRIFGTILNQNQANHKGMINCFYTGSAWLVYYFPALGSGAIDSSFLSTNTAHNGVKLSGGLTLDVDTTTGGLGFKGSSPNKKLYAKFNDTNMVSYSGKIGVKWGSIDSTRIKYKAITIPRMADLCAGCFLVGNNANRPSSLTTAQVQSLLGFTYAAGTGISIVGGVISNTMPAQPITFSTFGNITATGTYPTFTLTNTLTWAGAVQGTQSIGGITFQYITLTIDGTAVKLLYTP